MQIKNEELLHFHRSNEWDSKWVPGNTFEIDNSTPNSFLTFYENSVPFYNINNIPHLPKIAAKEMKRLLQYWGPQDFSNYLDFSLRAFEHCGMYMREQVFEEVRQAEFSTLPSRKHCIWVFRSSAADYWKGSLGPNLSLFKVRLTGNLHVANQLHLFSEINEHKILRENAEAYWKGSNGENPEQEECLFMGRVEVLEKVTQEA